jgi:3-methyladenine DNA glycosylase AlkD
MPAPEYLQFLEKQFTSLADADEAAKMKKYMKDRFDFYGVKSPERKELYREHRLLNGLIPDGQLGDITRWCWAAPQREWQYFVMEFLGKVARKVPPETISLYEYMIVNKSWWDSVDFLASNLVGPYLKKYPEKIQRLTGEWMRSENMWLQRTCLLFQLKYRDQTDTTLLSSFIDQLKGSREFFIRKAIGWALREYSKTNPKFVTTYVAEHNLSGLSEREALKWLKGKGMA